eukprot:7376087-Prymnesium_polylepis.1
MMDGGVVSNLEHNLKNHLDVNQEKSCPRTSPELHHSRIAACGPSLPLPHCHVRPVTPALPRAARHSRIAACGPSLPHCRVRHVTPALPRAARHSRIAACGPSLPHCRVRPVTPASP